MSWQMSQLWLSMSRHYSDVLADVLPDVVANVVAIGVFADVMVDVVAIDVTTLVC